ncbi:MAG: hypothetical protein IK092_06270, partial [Muribaculaceae bacterium]|nr:hypothetical protein [Muribaculaceae bacterium]
GWEFVQRLAANRPDTTNVAQAQERIGVLENGVDVTTQVIKGNGKQLLLLFPDIDKVNIAYTYVINEICEMAQSGRVDVLGLTSGSPVEMAQWNDISMATYKLYTADDSEIKMVARGNPALVYLEDGVIKWKRTLASVDHNRLHDPSMTLATLSDDFNPGSRLGKLVLWYVLFMAVLLLLNRLPQILGLARRRFDKGEKDSNFAEEELEEDDAPIVEDDDNETINT